MMFSWVFEFGVSPLCNIFANGHGAEECSALKRHAHVAAM